jgi:Holliday junction resolvasome RuvABC DNA-binding subunit
LPLASYASAPATPASDAISALVSLGISKIDAQNRVNNILAKDASTSINELIRLALRQEG